MLNKIGAFIVLLLGFAGLSVAILEKDKGKNSWAVENIGELSDLVFLDDNMVYTLSTDGVATLFKTDTKTIKWKKTLPRGKNPETYAMRHLGRNLLVHSSERAMLINSAGHVIFEVPFPEHKGKVPIEIF